MKKNELYYLLGGVFLGLLIGFFTGYNMATLQYNPVITDLQGKYEEQSYELSVFKKIEQELQKKTNFLENLDISSDESLQKFVNSEVSFIDVLYTPTELETIQSEVVIDKKGGISKLRPEAKAALQSMAKKFYEDLGYKFEVVSAYRSYSYQKGIENGSCPRTACARAGFSEHQSGLAVDLFSASTEKEWNNSEKLSEIFTWLKNNAHKFGFHNSYQKGADIDGYLVEPWHWRYVGKDFAEYLNDENITFAEFYTNLEK